MLLPDKSSLPCGVLAHHQHHWFVVKVGILQTRGMEVMEVVVLLQWQKLLAVEGLQTLGHSPDHFRGLLVIFSPPARHCVEGRTWGCFTKFMCLFLASLVYSCFLCDPQRALFFFLDLYKKRVPCLAMASELQI